MATKPSLRVFHSLIDESEYEVYINNRLWTNLGYYNEKDGLIHIDDFPKLNIKELNRLPITDFPNNFILQWSTEKSIHGLFDMFCITRKGSRISVEVYGNYYSYGSSKTFPMWNSAFFVKEMVSVARQLGHQSSCGTKLEDMEASITITAQYKIEGTIAQLFKKATDLILQIMEQANISLTQKAIEKWGK